MKNTRSLLQAIVSAALLSGCTPVVGMARLGVSNTPEPAAKERPVVVVKGQNVSGESGDVIEFSGWGFTSDDKVEVLFGDTEAAEVKIVDGWRIRVTVPPGRGAVDMCVSNGFAAFVVLEAFRYGNEPASEVATCLPGQDRIAARAAAVHTAMNSKVPGTVVARSGK